MVLPGIQALFGFQLIAVFNPNFLELLSHRERVIHLIAITLVAMAIALIMTPAAFQRQTSPQHVSRKFLKLSTRLLLLSMPLLCGGICIDFYLVAKIILADALLALVLAGCMLAFLLCFGLCCRACEHSNNFSVPSKHIACNGA